MILKAFRGSCVVLNTGDESERAMDRRVAHGESCDICGDYDSERGSERYKCLHDLQYNKNKQHST
jgi:hypothetical protein